LQVVGRAIRISPGAAPAQRGLGLLNSLKYAALGVATAILGLFVAWAIYKMLVVAVPLAAWALRAASRTWGRT